MDKELSLKDQLASIAVQKRLVQTTITVLRKEVAMQHQELELIKEGLAVDEFILQDPFKDAKEFFLVARQSLRGEFEKNCEVFEQEVLFLKDQIDEVTQDKLKVIQNSLLVEQKLRELSRDVGLAEQ